MLFSVCGGCLIGGSLLEFGLDVWVCWKWYKVLLWYRIWCVCCILIGVCVCIGFMFVNDVWLFYFVDIEK